MAQTDPVEQWKGFSPEQRTQALGRMSPQQKLALKGMLEKGATPSYNAPAADAPALRKTLMQKQAATDQRATAAADKPMASAQPAAPLAPPTPGFFKNKWQQANTPLGPKLPGFNSETARLDAVENYAQTEQGRQAATAHPVATYAKGFAAGMERDAPNLATPAFLATSVGGALGLIPRVVQSGLALLYGGLGAQDVAHAFTDTDLPIEERVQEGLGGAATITGAGTEAAGRAHESLSHDSGILRRGVQRIAGVGQKAVTDAVTATAAKAADDLETVRANNKAADERTEKAWGAVEDHNIAARQEATEKTEKARGAVDEKNAAAVKRAVEEKKAKIKKDQEALKAHHEKVETAKAETTKTRAAHQQRERVQGELDQTSTELAQAHTEAEETAEAENKANWKPVHEGTAGEKEDLTPLRQTAKLAGENADPVSLPIVRSILREGNVAFDEVGRPVVDGQVRTVMVNHAEVPFDNPNYARYYEMQYGELPPLAEEGGATSFARLHRLYSYIGSKLYGGGRLEPGTYNSLKMLQHGVDQAMGNIAERTGQTENLAKARKSHTEKMETFSDSPHEPATVASKSRQETTPEHVRAEAEAERLRKVARFNPKVATLSARAERLRGALKGLPEPTPLRKQVTLPPERPEGAPLPLPGRTERLPQAEPERTDYAEPVAPNLKERPQPSGQKSFVRSEVNLREVREKILNSFTKRLTLSGYDAGILASSLLAHPLMGMLGAAAGEKIRAGAVSYVAGKVGTRMALEGTHVREWLTRASPDEVRALRKVPHAELLKITDGLTQEAVKAKQEGRPVRLTREVAQLLGPKNLALIVGAHALSHPQTAGDAKKRVQAAQLAAAAGGVK